MGFSFTPSTHSRHPSYTLSSAHASRTHIKAPQTDFPLKPDNSSGLTHDSPSETPSRKKVTFRHKSTEKASRKAMEAPSSETTTQTKHGLTPLPAPSRSGIGTKARRAASKPRRHPPPCSEPWRKPRRHQVRSHGSTPQHRSHRDSAPVGLGSRSLGIGIGSPRNRDTAPAGAALLRGI